mgnify:FL=1|tara:strand:+ start:289 stop:864 length:576 start_codon:yes stop_codon:yes gene_type:complete
MKTQTYFCPQLERRVTSEEFNDAKKIYLENASTPKISIDWKIYEIDVDLLDEVFYYAVKYGYKPSIYENGKIPERAIRKYRNKIAERIADFVITSDAAETYSKQDYVKRLGVKEESVGDYEKMIKESVIFILNKYKGDDIKLLDKEIKFYGNSVMCSKYRKENASHKYSSAEEYIKGKSYATNNQGETVKI